MRIVERPSIWYACECCGDLYTEETLASLHEKECFVKKSRRDREVASFLYAGQCWAVKSKAMKWLIQENCLDEAKILIEHWMKYNTINMYQDNVIKAFHTGIIDYVKNHGYDPSYDDVKADIPESMNEFVNSKRSKQ